MNSNRPPASICEFSIYQIFYDEKSKSALDKNFIPLDNTNSARPDWYEFWVIRNFLISNELQNDRFYGFLSPKFRQKTGISGARLLEIFNTVAADVDVILVTSFSDQIVLHKNQFIQGDISHPGLLDRSQRFFDHIGISVDAKSLISTFSTSVYSNYIIAKPKYWKKWLELAEKFLIYSESSKHTSLLDVNLLTPYGGGNVPMKVFIQERLHSIVLTEANFNCYVPEAIQSFCSEKKKVRRQYFCELARLKDAAVSTNSEAAISEYERMSINYRYIWIKKYNYLFRLVNKKIPILSCVIKSFLVKKANKRSLTWADFSKINSEFHR